MAGSLVKTEPGKQWEIARELRKHLLADCDREGIKLPVPCQEVYVLSPELESTASSGE